MPVFLSSTGWEESILLFPPCRHNFSKYTGYRNCMKHPLVTRYSSTLDLKYPPANAANALEGIHPVGYCNTKSSQQSSKKSTKVDSCRE